MQRCMQCNSPLTSAETTCYSCHCPVNAKKNKGEFSDRFRTIINVVFIVFIVITVASLFIDGIPFWKCFAGVGVLYLVKNSADNMSEFRKK